MSVLSFILLLKFVPALTMGAPSTQLLCFFDGAGDPTKRLCAWHFWSFFFVVPQGFPGYFHVFPRNYGSFYWRILRNYPWVFFKTRII
jgi:hypothetical protein